MKIHKPPSPLTNPKYSDLPQGAELHRVHLTTFRAEQFNPGQGGPTRFAPFKDGNGAPVPSLHASASLPAAIHETIFHDIHANAGTRTARINEVYIRTHSMLRTNRALRLVELRNVSLSNWGISRNDLSTSGPSLYSQTVLWAEAIRRDIPDAGGLVWTSNQCDPDDACLFFGDRVDESDFTAAHSRDGETDTSFLQDVRDEGRRRGITLTI